MALGDNPSGNWIQLRQLVLRLLEEHEQVLEQLSCLVQGSPQNKGLVERIAKLEEQIQGIKEKLEKVETAKPEKRDAKTMALLIGAISILAAGIAKLVDLVSGLLTK